ncbi:MAG: hypothetical protein ACRYG7_33480 [Janthinobacterium lividum]
MKSTYPLLEKPKVIRPAAIAIRFTGTDTPNSPFRKALNLYQSILCITPVAGRKDDYQYYSFPVGSAKDPKEKDIELRLELRATDDTPLKNRTVIYWEIKPAKDGAAIKEIKEELGKLGYNRVLDDSGFLMEDSFIVGDDSEYLFGGSPNVRFPPHLVEEKQGFFANASPVTGLLVGLALGPLLISALAIFRNSRRLSSRPNKTR